MSRRGPIDDDARAAGGAPGWEPGGMVQLVTSPWRALARPSPGQEPALDVLRAVAILLVILGHLRSTYLDLGGHESAFIGSPLAKRGWMGADLFFVLSGYLIGKQLFAELAQRGAIDVGRFILRRGLRVWPLYFAFVVAVWVVAGAPPRADAGGGVARAWPDVLFLANYVAGGAVRGGWSICIEEQFYLLAPLGLVAIAAVTAARGAGGGGDAIRACRRALIAALVLLPVVRAVTWAGLTGGVFVHDSELFVSRLIHPFHLHADGLVVGLLIASADIGRRGAGPATGSADRGLGVWSSGRAVIAAAVGCVALIAVAREVLTFTGLAVLFGAVTAFCVARRDRPVGPAPAGAARVLARLSFGMYLNHRYVLDGVTGGMLRRVSFGGHFAGAHAALAFVVVTVLSALLAAATFCVIEHPFLELRRGLFGRTGSPRGA